MRIKIKSVIFVISLFVNTIFILLFVLSGFSKVSSFTFFNPDNYLTAAAVVSVPKSCSAAVELITINIKTGNTAYIQFSIISGEKKQGNLIFTPLYDPNIIDVAQTGYGIEITALKEGETLVQTLSNDGIKDVAKIIIAE